MNARRLLKLADFLDTLPRAKFDFSTIMRVGTRRPLAALRAGEHVCGTAGCAIGWMPAVWPRLLTWTHSGQLESRNVRIYEGTNFDIAARFFSITYEQTQQLFIPLWTKDSPGMHATPKMVAKHIRRWVKTKQRDEARGVATRAAAPSTGACVASGALLESLTT